LDRTWEHWRRKHWRIQGLDPFGAQVMADNLAKDVMFSNAAGNELAVLTAKIQNQNKFSMGRIRHRQ
jgi:hypothetical protein